MRRLSLFEVDQFSEFVFFSCSGSGISVSWIFRRCFYSSSASACSRDNICLLADSTCL